jgi:hypothetical protein
MRRQLTAPRHLATLPVPSFALPPAAVIAAISRPQLFQTVSPCVAPPEGEGWLHEIKHDEHRLPLSSPATICGN